VADPSGYRYQLDRTAHAKAAGLAKNAGAPKAFADTRAAAHFSVLVVLMAAHIAPTQLKIAALAVLLSLATSYARLLLTHGELRRSAEALLDHHQLLNAIIEGTTAATYVKDLQGRYLLMNSAGAAFVGKSVPEILGKDDQALFSRESAQRIIARDRQTVDSGVVETYQEETTTVEGVTRTYLSTKGPFRDAQGRVVGLVGSSLDITDRYHAIEALAESEERFRTIFDGSPVGWPCSERMGP